MPTRFKSIFDEPYPDKVFYLSTVSEAGFDLIQQYTRLGILRAAKRLNIDESLYVKIPLDLVPEWEGFELEGWEMRLPTFNPMTQSEADWKKAAQQVFDGYCKDFLARARKEIKGQVEAGSLIEVKVQRYGGRNASQPAREEWTAKRYLLKMRYKDIARDANFNDTKVKQSVHSLLRQAGLPVK